MEKTLRKEKEGNPASQVPPSSAKQKGEAAGKVETGPSPRRGGRDQREKKPDGNCIACYRDKRRSIPPKTRWKEEQKEKARSMGSSGKENLTAEQCWAQIHYSLPVTVTSYKLLTQSY